MPIAINGSGTITGLSVGGLPDGTVDTDTLATSVKRGKILQVKQTQLTSHETLSANTTWTDISGLTITTDALTATSSKVLVSLNFNFSVDGNGCGHHLSLSRTVGGTTTDYIADGANADSGGANAWMSLNNNYDQSNSLGIMINSYGDFLDSPNTTSAVTYKVRYYKVSGASTFYMNRSRGGPYATARTTLTIQEVAA